MQGVSGPRSLPLAAGPFLLARRAPALRASAGALSIPSHPPRIVSAAAMPMRRVAENGTTVTCAACAGKAAATTRSIPDVRCACCRTRQLVHFRREDQHGPPAGGKPGEDFEVEFGEAVARVDDEDESDQRLARRQIAREEFLPVALQLLGHGGVAVARKIGEQRARAQPEKLMCCVRPGVLLVNASRVRLASVLIALDLPAFERPANAISGGPGGGNCSSYAAAVRNSACCSGCFITAFPAGVREVRRSPGRIDSVTMERFCTCGPAAAPGSEAG